MALTKIDDRGLKTPIDLLDNEKIRFGTGNDLEIYHDGSHSYIKEAGTGNLYISASSKVQIDGANNETMARFNEDGGVELYYDNSKQFETVNGGVQVVGNLGIGVTPSRELHVKGLDAIVRLESTSATGRNVLEFYDTTGSKGYIGYPSTSNDQFTIGNNDNTDMWFSTNDTERLRITNGGIVRIPDNGKFTAGAGDDLQIYHSGSHSFIKDSGTGNLQIWTNQLSLLNSGGTESMIQAVENAQVELYYDNSKKFETTSLGAKVTGDLQMGGTAGVKFSHTGTTSIFETQTAGDSLLIKTTPSGGSTTERLRITSGSVVEFYSPDGNSKGYIYQTNSDNFIVEADANDNIDGDLLLRAVADGGTIQMVCGGNNERMRIASNGDVKITSRGSGDSGAPFYVAVTGKSTSTYVGGADDTACVRIVDNGSTDSYYHGIELRSKNGGDTRIYCHDRGSGDKADLVFTLDNSGLNERIRFRSERGICFNGDTADANAIDDYEEGTWTPTATAGTFTTGTGTYVKIGRLVTAYFVIEVHSSTSTNYMQFNGLPYTNSGNAGENESSISYNETGNAMNIYVSGSGVAGLFTNDSFTFYTYANCSGDRIRGSVSFLTVT